MKVGARRADVSFTAKVGTHQKQSAVRTNLNEVISAVGVIGWDGKSASDAPSCLCYTATLRVKITNNDHNTR